MTGCFNNSLCDSNCPWWKWELPMCNG